VIDDIVFTIAEDATTPSTPERVLLVHVLERALFDALSTCSTIKPHVTREAIAWFLNPPETTTGFSFAQIVEEFRLTPKRIKYILDKVRDAKRRNEDTKLQSRSEGSEPQERPKKQAKRKNRGKRMGELLKGTWFNIGQENAAVLWQGRDIGCGSKGAAQFPSRSKARRAA
jgi:hypothetical protein